MNMVRRVGVRENAVRVLLALILGLASFAFCQQAARLSFRAKVSDLPQQNNPLARNKRPEDFVTITLPGQLRNPPLAVNLIQKTRADWSTPENAIASIRSANTAGDADWILLNFVPAEQQDVQKLVGDAAILKNNTEYASSVQKAEITGSAEYGKFTIVFLREESGPNQSRIVPVTLIRTPSGWKQTNALSNDHTFDIVWTALRSGGVH